ncbi:MAG TPA: hypothetical protein VFQ25_12400 [Ktedonobacterales bacterium]|nr:hypothetical protein [Ktedonobacterales bacterium]
MTPNDRKPTRKPVGRQQLAIILALALAWLGLWAHEAHRMPALFGLTPDGSLPLLAIAVALLAWWLRAARKRAPTVALLVYALINGVGGLLSVLPLPVLPFVPEQTLDHYLIHALYALCQVPLIIVALVALTPARASSATAPARARCPPAGVGRGLGATARGAGLLAAPPGQSHGEISTPSSRNPARRRSRDAGGGVGAEEHDVCRHFLGLQQAVNRRVSDQDRLHHLRLWDARRPRLVGDGEQLAWSATATCASALCQCGEPDVRDIGGLSCMLANYSPHRVWLAFCSFWAPSSS